MARMVFAVLAVCVAGFHIGVILGAPWGALTMGGRWPGVLPPAARVLSALSGGLVLGMAAVVWRGRPRVGYVGGRCAGRFGGAGQCGDAITGGARAVAACHAGHAGGGIRDCGEGTRARGFG